jgi:hypothetical protein
VSDACSILEADLRLSLDTHNSGTAHAAGNTTGSNLVSSENRGESNVPAMSRDPSDTAAGSALGPRKSKSLERMRTPSPPPPKISTIPHPDDPLTSSSSHLMPPSLSFTAPTPEASPISRTGHQQVATEPPQSVLKSSTPPIVRSASTGHTGKRKADEAGVEGGNTPPKDQPRATFALEPRRTLRS